MASTIKTDDVISHILKGCLEDVESCFKSSVLIVRSPIILGLDDIIKNEIEEIVDREKNKRKENKLTVILETSGGYIEVAERIHKVFRHHFNEVDFIIPNFAYSAGTVLALSGDNIYMDYYSVLGPIDPQVMNKDGSMVPGLGYLQKYKELIEKAEKEGLSEAEIEFLVRKFDPAELYSLEKAVEHSKSLIREWLPKYKFKNWDKTETEGRDVTEEMKKKRAEQIADILGDPERWKTHSREIFMKDLDSEEIKLKIIDLATVEDEGRKKVFQYYDLFIDYCAKIGVQYAIHSRNGLKPIYN